uniref:Uncharacterized protein n=1 Tax=Arion vulgaris TaxID=1028688 RepID=A0A0B6ZFM7_9EUPU
MPGNPKYSSMMSIRKGHIHKAIKCFKNSLKTVGINLNMLEDTAYDCLVCGARLLIEEQ